MSFLHREITFIEVTVNSIFQVAKNNCLNTSILFYHEYWLPGTTRVNYILRDFVRSS